MLDIPFFVKSEIIIYVAYALLAGAVFLISKGFLEEQEAREVEENLDDLKSRRASSFLIKFARPMLSQYIVPMVRGKKYLNWEKSRAFYRRKLIAAGLKDELTPDEFIAFKFFLMIFFPMALAALKGLRMVEIEWYILPITSIVGYFYPNLFMRFKVQARQKQVLKTLPFIVDLLALSTEAGLDFVGALGKVVEKATPGPLVEELEQMIKEIRVGSSRAEALREMSYRLDLQEVNSFVAILISADQMGASIGRVLRQQSEQIRSQRFIRAEKMGAQAAQKLLIPLFLLILPSVGIMTVGPFILSMMN